MTIEQYNIGAVRAVTGSRVVHALGLANWGNSNVVANSEFRVSIPGYRSYTIATILNATQLQLSTAYVEASTTYGSYTITRSFTANRNYARLFRGDSHSADILRSQVIDKIDEDVGKLYDGTASLNGMRFTSSDSTHYWDIAVNATGEMTFSYNSTKKAYVTTTGTWTEV